MQEIWPIDAPGMPAPGKSFVDAARAMGDEVEIQEIKEKRKKGDKKRYRMTYGAGMEHVIHRALYDQGTLTLNFDLGGGRKKELSVLSGMRWGREGHAAGPEPCEVMVVGKWLTDNEINAGRIMVRDTGEFLVTKLRELGFEKINRWYLTNVMKTTNFDPERTDKMASSWMTEFMHLLAQEMRLVRPKYVLCLGADAVRAVLGKTTLKSMQGRCAEVTIPVHKSADDPPEYHTMYVMAADHPVTVMKDPDIEERFDGDLARFRRLIEKGFWDDKETDIDHRILSTEGQLRDLIYEMERDNDSGIVAFDAEWHGQHPQNHGSYVRCMQVSWKEKHAALIALTHAGGAPRFKRFVRDKRSGLPILERDKQGRLRPKYTTQGGVQVATDMLARFLRTKRICGHFLVSDLEWAEAMDMDLVRTFEAPLDWRLCRTEGGLDTATMEHAHHETAAFDLNSLTLRYTTAPRYDLALEEWKKKWCAEHDIKPSHMEGYGECPDEILYPYGLYDADVTYRNCMKLLKILDKDAYGNDCWEHYWNTHRTMPAVLEINTTGLLVDRQRLDTLVTQYYTVREQMRKELRSMFKWETLNFDSHDDARELLFGERFNNPDDDGVRHRRRPDDAVALFLHPVTTTGKRPKPWEEVLAEGKESEYRPSGGKTPLGVMLAEHNRLKVWDVHLEQYVHRKTVTVWDAKAKGGQGDWREAPYEEVLQKIRDFKIISQILKNTLRVPKIAEGEDCFEEDDDGNLIYDVGLPGSICDDGRVRTYISPLKETGRWSSARPPLQNLSKRRESDYKRILGKLYKNPLRSIFTADEGYTLVEVDFVGAELFGMAIMSGDAKMIEHAIRNQLPEDDPNFYDIHSNVAVLAFRLQCEPTKTGLKKIGMEHMRIIAKSVIFGVAYGRGAKAIAFAAREEGVSVTVEDAQRVIDALFEMYPGLVPFFAQCRGRAVDQKDEFNEVIRAAGFMFDAFGGMRRFPKTLDRSLAGDFERQAMNFPIQGMIARAMNRAVDNLVMYRKLKGLGFKIALQIHDALLFLVPDHELKHFIDVVLPTCMTKGVPIWPCNLDGSPKEEITEPYHLQIDVEIYEHWGDHMMPTDCQRHGYSEELAGWKQSDQFDGYECKALPEKVWLSNFSRLASFVADKKGSKMLQDEAVALAVRLGVQVPPEKQGLSPEDYVKSLKGKDLLKLITNEEGAFIAA